MSGGSLGGGWRVAVTGSLDAEARRAAIVERLISDGRLLLKETAHAWGVHPMTIRRDFEALESEGLARRVRGGIVSVGADDFSQRQHRNATAKRRIAEKLSGFITDGMTIGLDASTTVHQFAAAFPAVTSVSVITNGLATFQALSARQGVRTFLTGGEREEQTFSLVGPLTVRALRQYNIDLCVISARSVDARFGTSETTLEQIAVKEAMAEASKRTVLAVDSGKLDTRSRVRSLGLDQIDVMVTELDPKDTRLDPYRDRVQQIL
jgi:DeoR family fructose operon transcriptional repressor